MAKFFRFPWATAGDKTAVPDVTDVSGFVSYQQGYGADYQRDPSSDPLAKRIERNKMNQVFADITDNLRHYQIHTFPEYITSADNGGTPFAYDINSVVRFDPGTGYKLYQNTTAGNTAAPNVSGWNVFTLTSEALNFIKPVLGAALFTKVNAYSISIPIGTKVLVGDTLVSVTSLVTLSLNVARVGGLDTGAKAAGTDYSVYALSTGSFIISASKTVPVGYTTLNSKRIGGFHYGVIPEAFTAINNITASDATKIAGINSYSFWDLKFRPVCDPSGMVFIFGRWYDIYLTNTDHHLYGTSAAGKTIAGGTISNGRNYPKIPLFYGGDGTTTYGTFTWFEAAEVGKAYSKDMISYSEFVAIAYGVLEASSASTADTGITQHLANYTSKFGICMATGCQWIWSKDVFSDTSGTYVWQAVTEGRGSVYSVGNNPKAAVFGGLLDHTTNSGSRSSGWSLYVWNTYWYIGCRFACSHLSLA